MSNLREAAQKALEFVQLCWTDVYLTEYEAEKRDEVDEALRAALAQPDDKAQPVATQRDRLLAALERSAKAESMLRSLVDECDNDSVEGWEDRMRAIIECANRLLSSTSQPPAEQQAPSLGFMSLPPATRKAMRDSYPGKPAERGAEFGDDAVRERFEDWMKKQRTQTLERYGNTYRNAHVRCRWEGWKAAMLAIADRAERGGAA